MPILMLLVKDNVKKLLDYVIDKYLLATAFIQANNSVVNICDNLLVIGCLSCEIEKIGTVDQVPHAVTRMSYSKILIQESLKYGKFYTLQRFK